MSFNRFTQSGFSISRASKGLLVRLLLALGSLAPALANAAITIEPLTWNIVGLDSNNVNVGPDTFPVGARVCNDAASSVEATVDFVWNDAFGPYPGPTGDPFINLRPGSLQSLSLTIPGAVGAVPGCADAYFEAQVTRIADAYDKTRNYQIRAIAGTGTETETVLTPSPRQLYVEYLVSQNRNGVTAIELDGVPVPAGGSMSLMVGNEYEITLIGYTATQGYNQLESFITLSNTIFQIQSVKTTFSADTSPFFISPIDKLYLDACGWENNPGSPNYLSCVGGDGKAGGTVSTTYRVKILSGAGTAQTLTSMLYDFSGSSFHYNSDNSVSGRVANIIGPSSVTIDKTFSPKAIPPGGTSTMTFKLSNPTSETFTSVNFADTTGWPSGVTVSGTQTVIYSGCGASPLPTTATGGVSSLSFSNITLIPNSVCTISVVVTAAANGSYPNTTGHLFINSTLDTGNTGSDTLTVSSGAACVAGQTLATWTFPSSSSASTPAPFFQATNVATATASTTVTSPTIDLLNGKPLPSWSGEGFPKDGTITGNSAPHFQFIVDTSKYSDVKIAVDYEADANWGGGGAVSTPTLYVWSSTTGSSGTYSSVYTSATLDTTWRSSGAVSATTNSSGSTWFKVNAVGAINANSNLQIDNVTITGCGIPAPAPTITKAFLTDPVKVGATSTLRFTINNTASGNVDLTGIAFTDVLPAGLSVATTAPSSACNGTNNLTLTAPGSISLTGGSLAADASCTIDVPVTGTAAGQYTNVSGFISSNESGVSINYATDSLTVIAPPTLEKSFQLASIDTGATSTLSFTITNPNLATPLNGIGFTDSLPAGVTVAGATTSVCGGTNNLTTTAPDSIALTGGTLAANTTCTFSVTVTGATAGAKDNTTSAVTSTEGGDGNTASATLTVRDPVPLIGLNKQISLDGINWFKAVGLTPTANVYYRFTVSNDGETALSGVAVTDPNFPTLCSLNTSLAVGITDSCVVGPQSITAVPTPNPFVNTATATTSTYTPSLPVTSSAEYGTKSITLEKSAGQAYFTAVGNVLTYQYKVTNTGGYPLLGPVSVTDNKVNGVAPNLLSCPDLTGIYLQPGGSVTCTGSYTVTASDVNNQKVENTASATLAGVVSPVDKVTVPLAPDFTASKTNNVSGAVTLGGNFVWTLTVTNSATAGAATFADGQTLLRDDLPSSGAAYSAGTVSGTGTTGTINCDITSNTLTCKANGAVTMPSGASFSVPITVTPSAAVALVNPRTAGVCAADPLDVFPELDDGNNACSDTVTVSNPPVLSKPTIAKAFGTSPIAAGGTSTITFTLTNPNATALTGASFSDTLTDMSVNAAGAAGGTCTGAGSNNLTAGQTALSLSGLTLPGSGTNGGVCTVTVVVTSTTSGVHPNTASGVTTTETPTAGTGSNTANLTVLGAPTIAKAFGTSPIAAGGTSTITFTLTNPNATALTGASFSDTLTDMSVNAAGAAGGTCTGAGSNNLTAGQTALSLSGLTLPGSGTNGGVCTVTVVVTSSTSGVHPNTTSGVTTTETPTAGTGSNTANLTVLGADIIAQKNGPALIAANGLITYTVRVSNAGPSAAVGAVVTDPLPEGLSDMLWTCDAAVGGAVCPNPSGNGAISQTIAVFPAGSSLTYTITGTGPASGSVNNQVTITPPQGVTDPNPANNTDSVTTLIGANPSTADLAVFKYGPSTVEANGAITYVILVTNAGYAAANGAVFSDSVPVGFTWTCGNAVGGGVCPNPAGTGAIEETLATFPAGASLTYRVTGSGPASGSVSNTATITAPAVVTDPDLTNNTSSAVTTVGPVSGQADLSLVKTGSLAPGGSVTYTLVVSNAGPNDALNARVVDDLPAALTEVAWNCGNGTGGGSCIDEEDTGDIDTTVNLPVGATVTFTITANTPESGAFVNTAIVIPPAGLVDPDPSNNPSGAVILQLGEIADMAVTLGGLPSEAAPGALVSGTVTCANVGTAPAREVTCALAGGTLGICRVDGAQVTLPPPLATLAAGKAIVCDLTATAPASGNLQLIATTDAENDSDPANNQDEVAIPVDLPVPLLPPTLYKAFTPSIIDPGQASTLSITLGNANSSALLLSAALEDTLPTGVTVISPVVLTGTTCTIGSVSTTSGSVSYANGASIPPGGCVIKVQVSATVGGKYVNLLAVGDLQTNGGGNVEPAEAVLYVDPADLAITKTLTTAGPYAAGQVISFTIVGTNNGPDAATGVVITDVPSNLTIQSVSGACTALPCTLGNLAVGSTVSITVVARINAVGNFTNTATITGAQPDPVPANNSASANGQAVDPIPPVAIPTLTELGMILMSLFLLAMARRRMSQGR